MIKHITIIVLLQLLFLTSFLSYSQAIDLESNTIVLSTANDAIPIFEKSAFYKENGNVDFNLQEVSKLDFTILEELYYYQALEDETLWTTFTVENNTNNDFNYYYTIRNPYLYNATVFLVNNEETKKLHTYNYQKLKRENRYLNYPTWKLAFPGNTRTKVYVKIYETGGRAKIASLLKGEKDFLNYSTFSFGIHAIFGFFILGVFIFSVYISKYSGKKFIVFYGLYALFLLVDYLCVHGIGQSYLWTDSDFMLKNTRSISHALSAFFISLFFANFYNQGDYPKWVRKVFIITCILFGGFLTLYIIKFFFGGLISLFLVLWKFISIFSILLITIHMYLAFKKRIPFYLPLVFILHTCVTFINANFIFSYSSNVFIDWIFFNIYYITLSIEIIVWTYFIFRNLKKDKIESLELQKEFDVLQKELNRFRKEQADKIETSISEIIHLKSKSILNSSDILYVKSDGHYVEYFTNTKSNPEIDRNSLNEVLKLLPSSSFVRIHKSYIVNVYRIKIINSTQVMLDNGVWINLSRTYKQQLKDILHKDA